MTIFHCSHLWHSYNGVYYLCIVCRRNDSRVKRTSYTLTALIAITIDFSLMKAKFKHLHYYHCNKDLQKIFIINSFTIMYETMTFSINGHSTYMYYI